MIVEQTFFKAKRRIAYIDEIRKAADVIIEIYVICLPDTLWKSNLKKREMGGRYFRGKSEAVAETDISALPLRNRRRLFLSCG